jgi:hypothetical protein
MSSIQNRTVELEVLASAIRRQEQRFHRLIDALEKNDINPLHTQELLRAIETELRRPPSLAA